MVSTITLFHNFDEKMLYTTFFYLTMLYTTMNKNVIFTIRYIYIYIYATNATYHIFIL